MPNRILREGILTSDRVNSLGLQAEVFYRRLMSVVDDYGRFDARPSVLRVTCYPLKVDSIREADISRSLAEAQSAGLIALYEVNDKPYLQMLDFRQQVRAKDSKYPASDGVCDPPATHMHSTCKADATHMHTKTRAESETESETYSYPNTRERERGSDTPANAPSLEKIREIAAPIGVPDSDIEAFYAYYESQNWHKANGQKVTNIRAALQSWKIRGQQADKRTEHAKKDHRRATLS